MTEFMSNNELTGSGFRAAAFTVKDRPKLGRHVLNESGHDGGESLDPSTSLSFQFLS
jgi:hypothetical protein